MYDINEQYAPLFEERKHLMNTIQCIYTGNIQNIDEYTWLWVLNDYNQ